MSPDHATDTRTVADLGRLARAACLARQTFATLPLAVPMPMPMPMPMPGKIRPEDAHKIQLIGAGRAAAATPAHPYLGTAQAPPSLILLNEESLMNAITIAAHATHTLLAGVLIIGFPIVAPWFLLAVFLFGKSLTFPCRLVVETSGTSPPTSRSRASPSG